MAELHAIHHSIPLGGVLPRRMTKMRLSADQATFVEQFALSIFTDCVNAGRTFQAAITACYLSGLQNGLALAAAQAKEAGRG